MFWRLYVPPVDSTDLRISVSVGDFMLLTPVWLVRGPEGPLALVKSCLRSDYLLGQLGSRVQCLGFFSLAVKVKA